jgi:hypothetical protein
LSGGREVKTMVWRIVDWISEHIFFWVLTGGREVKIIVWRSFQESWNPFFDFRPVGETWKLWFEEVLIELWKPVLFDFLPVGEKREVWFEEFFNEFWNTVLLFSPTGQK